MTTHLEHALSTSGDTPLTSTPFLALHQIIEAARRSLSDEVWNYLVGGADSETTLLRERQAFDEWAWIPRILEDVTHVDVRQTLFGKTLDLPILLAGMGSLGRIHPESISAVAKAAASTGTALGVSSVTESFFHTAAEQAPEAVKIYQLYVEGDDAWLLDQATTAMQSGYDALALTVDVPIFSRRERDILGTELSRANSEQPLSRYRAGLTWSKVQRLRDNFSGNLIIKGIMSPKDADIACQLGVNGVYVSTHGGRQLDHSLASLQALPAVVSAVAGRAIVFVDGGFCRGTDVFKALALGADIVGIGRLYGYGLAADGQAGVSEVLRLLGREMQIAMALLGVTSLNGLTSDLLQPCSPVTRGNPLKHAFPLINLT